MEVYLIELTQILTRTEVLLESNMLGTLILSYIYLLFVLVVSFLNIYSIDKYEFLNNQQKCFEFKHKLFFVIMYSKEKHIISKKTLISELVGYLVFITSVIVFICSLKQDVKTAIILLGIVALVVFTFGCITGIMYRKIKKHKN